MNPDAEKHRLAALARMGRDKEEEEKGAEQVEQVY